MGQNYYVRVRGRVLGPYTLDAVSAMARKAQIGRSHEASLDGESWRPASEFPEIFERPPVPSATYVPASTGPGSVPTPSFPPQESDSFSGGMLWYFTKRGEQQPTAISQAALVNLIASGEVSAEDHVWCETMSSWDVVSRVPQLAAFALPSFPRSMSLSGATQSAATAHRGTPASVDSHEYRAFVSKKTGAGILALFLGNLGVHKFMLGLTTGGLTMLVLFLMLIPIPFLTLVSFVEGVIYLSKSDEQFYQDYAVRKKQWF